MDRQQELEREVEFLRKLVTAQNEMIGKLVAERFQPSPLMIPLPYPVPSVPVPDPQPYIPPMYPYEPPPPFPWWQRPPGTIDVICGANGCAMIPQPDAFVVTESSYTSSSTVQ